MRTVVQRVRSASVTISGRIAGEIQEGLLVLLGIGHLDTADEVRWMAEKIAALRIFSDDEGRMNRSVRDISGGVLVVSQFTLLARTKKGTRPSFDDAAKPPVAVPLYELFLVEMEKALGRAVARGEFGADMQVALVNDGPVTIVIDTPARADSPPSE
ncbi:D-tyrosyl-tRNA(Tyr) deacylase [Opitutaceae bacterium EW11]|nr:D-tyrosyl-tRNA(Tyr) deacylase [Opitutaceae bacterium EW11]